METKYNIADKAWGVNCSRISEGHYYYTETVVYGETRSKAKSQLLIELNGVELITGEDITFLNIPIIRKKEEDLYHYNNKKLTLDGIRNENLKQQRLLKFDKIMNDETIRFCYIIKNGSYYGNDMCGYYSRKINAGIYDKKEAINHAKCCDELDVIPINIEDHNKMMHEQLDKLSSKLITCL